MDRYSRQLLYKNIGIGGQKKLCAAKVSIIGIGAIGTWCSELLVRAGIGSLELVDRDYVELSNLQRQALFDESDLLKPKSAAAAARLLKINPKLKIRAIVEDIDFKNITKLGEPDLILACTDNLDSRFLINDYCLKHNVPLISGAAVSDTGLIIVNMPHGPCLRCILPNSSEETCSTAGILNTISAAVGAIMANEAIRMIATGKSENSLIHMDIWKNKLEMLKPKKRPGCPACGKKFEYLSGNIRTRTVKMCGKGSYQIRGNKLALEKLAEKLSKIGKVTRLRGVVHFGDITLFEDGRAMIVAEDEMQAKKKYHAIFG